MPLEEILRYTIVAYKGKSFIMAPKSVTTNEKTTTTMTCFILQYNDYICNAQFKQSSNVVYMYTVSFSPFLSV